MKKIVCISGKAQAGKDTFARAAKKELEAFDKKVLIIHYADLLKWICRKFLGWDGKKDEKGRAMLQVVGTDIVRKKLPCFWTDFVFDFIHLFGDLYDYALIPDVRFPNEVNCLTGHGWEVEHIRIERPGFDNGLTSAQAHHKSENALDNFPVDLTIMNIGTLAQFKESAKTYIEGEFI